MTIAAKCECGKSPYYCVGGEGCRWSEKSLNQFFVENNCTEDEQNQLRMFLFLIRNKNVNFSVLEGIIRKYSDILMHST